MQAAARAASALCNIDLPRATRQYHADMHPGQEAARRDVFPASARVSDFSHVIGATRSSSSSHRSGLFSLAKNNLSREGQRLMPLIEHTIHLLRVAPTALIFHTLASLLFDTLLSQQTFQSNDGIRALSGLGTDSRGSPVESERHYEIQNPIPAHMHCVRFFCVFGRQEVAISILSAARASFWCLNSSGFLLLGIRFWRAMFLVCSHWTRASTSESVSPMRADANECRGYC